MKKNAATLLLLLSACAAPHRQTIVTQLPSLDREAVWQLVAIRGKEVKASNITLIVNTQSSTISGQAACNHYFANYTASNSSDGRRNIQLTPVNLTEIQCPEADMLAEQRYISLIQKTDAASWTAYELILYQHNREILKFEIQ